MDDNEKIYHASGACIQPLTWGWIHAPYYHLDGKRQIILWKLFARKFCIINKGNYCVLPEYHKYVLPPLT